MKKPTFSEIWNRIDSLVGQLFHTKTGREFTYMVSGNTIVPSRTDYQLSKADFEKVYRMVPLSGPGSVNGIVRGPAYIWAILHDERVTKGAW